MLETGIGRAHNIALSTLPNFTLPGDVTASKRYWEEDIIDPEDNRLAARNDSPFRRVPASALNLAATASKNLQPRGAPEAIASSSLEAYPSTRD